MSKAAFWVRSGFRAASERAGWSSTWLHLRRSPINTARALPCPALQTSCSWPQEAWAEGEEDPEKVIHHHHLLGLRRPLLAAWPRYTQQQLWSEFQMLEHPWKPGAWVMYFMIMIKMIRLRWIHRRKWLILNEFLFFFCTDFYGYVGF